MYYVYVIQSLKDARTYTGYTKDIKSRLKQHNSGQVNATKNRKPLKLLILESFATIAEAKKRELWWKSSGGRRKLTEYFQKVL